MAVLEDKAMKAMEDHWWDEDPLSSWWLEEVDRPFLPSTPPRQEAVLRFEIGDASPLAISYNAAISACEKGRQWHGTLQLLHEIPGKAIAPDTASGNAAISACRKGQQWWGALPD